MTEDDNKKYDEAIVSIFRAGGMTLNIYKSDVNLNNMRQTMRKIMTDNYIEGSNDCAAAMRAVKK